jgi:hypothetical protein
MKEKDLFVGYCMGVILTSLLVLLVSARAKASEPVFCSVEYFKQHELPTNAPNTKRLRCFQIGKLKLCGMAVGSSESDPYEMASLSPAPESAKYCTWYFNSGDELKQQLFHHVHLVGPYMSWSPFITRDDIADDYERKLNPQLSMMLSCVEKYGYKGWGCNGQRHRGPSEFAWFLGVVGCSPEVAERIAFYKWHLNGVKRSTRLEIAKRGYELGHKYPEYRTRFQKVMGE